MSKPKNKFTDEEKYSLSNWFQPNDQKFDKPGEKNPNRANKSARFYTVDTIIDLIDHIKRL